MIGYLRGTALSADERGVLLDVNGVGYDVHCPLSVVRAAREGGPLALYVRTHVREDAIKLFGFLHARERDLFDRLTAVAGVGAKLALSALSVMSYEDIALAAAAGDKAAFARVPGVGPKLAARIASELKPAGSGQGFWQDHGGEPSAPASGGTLAAAQPSAMNDVVLALEKLGYSRSEAFRVAAIVSEREPGAPAETLVMAALRILSGA